MYRRKLSYQTSVKENKESAIKKLLCTALSLLRKIIYDASSIMIIRQYYSLILVEG